MWFAAETVGSKTIRIWNCWLREHRCDNRACSSWQFWNKAHCYISLCWWRNNCLVLAITICQMKRTILWKYLLIRVTQPNVSSFVRRFCFCYPGSVSMCGSYHSDITHAPEKTRKLLDAHSFATEIILFGEVKIKIFQRTANDNMANIKANGWLNERTNAPIFSSIAKQSEPTHAPFVLAPDEKRKHICTSLKSRGERMAIVSRAPSIRISILGKHTQPATGMFSIHITPFKSKCQSKLHPYGSFHFISFHLISFQHKVFSFKWNSFVAQPFPHTFEQSFSQFNKTEYQLLSIVLKWKMVKSVQMWAI